jgi:hypothetical protein
MVQLAYSPKKVYGSNDVGKLDHPAGIIQRTPDWKWF